ncbi:MAG TPA: RNA polymerase subunit sigma-24, partial [Planctomycetes bacterium]|nr:RNA polymerase subunit sigma-24 [Planctomycetota bacterium]
KHRLVVELREIDGMEHRDIAETLGIPEGTVWSRLSIGRRKLREVLRARLSEDTLPGAV